MGCQDFAIALSRPPNKRLKLPARVVRPAIWCVFVRAASRHFSVLRPLSRSNRGRIGPARFRTTDTRGGGNLLLPHESRHPSRIHRIIDRGKSSNQLDADHLTESRGRCPWTL